MSSIELSHSFHASSLKDLPHNTQLLQNHQHYSKYIPQPSYFSKNPSHKVKHADAMLKIHHFSPLCPTTAWSHILKESGIGLAIVSAYWIPFNWELWKCHCSVVFTRRKEKRINLQISRSILLKEVNETVYVIASLRRKVPETHKNCELHLIWEFLGILFYTVRMGSRIANDQYEYLWFILDNIKWYKGVV